MAMAWAAPVSIHRLYSNSKRTSGPAGIYHHFTSRENTRYLQKWQFHVHLASPSKQGRFKCITWNALPEAAAAVAMTVVVVGAAATILVRQTKSNSSSQSKQNKCEACNGSGICSECNGEGFILKKLSEEAAARARKNAKDAATRYTAGLPKKWNYCSKCSGSRSCLLCDGRGLI